MRRAVPLLTAVVTLIAVGALPFSSTSASTLAGNLGVTGTRTTDHAIPSDAHFVTIGQSSSQRNSENQQRLLCLRNSNTYCAAINPMDIIQVVIENMDQIQVVWDWIKSFGGDGGKEEEPQSEGDTNQDNHDTDDNGPNETPGECMRSTGGDLTFGGCGPTPSVWIEVPHGAGSYLINKYLYDKGIIEVLTVRNTINGYHLYVATEGTSGTFQTWSWYNFCCNPSHNRPLR